MSSHQVPDLTLHPTFSQPPRTVWFKVEGVGFACDVNRIIRHSRVLRDAFLIFPGPEAESPEGTKENPYEIPGITQAEFEIFLHWLDHMGWEAPEKLSEEHLVIILKMTVLWEIEDGIKFAIHHLDKKPLSPARRLQLAQHFSIHPWIEQPVKQLLACSTLSLSEDDARCIASNALCMVPT
ncbi:hypothetical protein NP233_g4770 [Leucocoprinus birnbaumii]|uniref:BTB domain-containing protein n=1 Tax=Leucocoprinus birnbaumii TaxID=56174 RepID=A0AAD5VU54_9AGAR|nr:hypothetical protein NP233_g4770 [Leucocoprinus birnbaumii]